MSIICIQCYNIIILLLYLYYDREHPVVDKQSMALLLHSTYSSLLKKVGHSYLLPLCSSVQNCASPNLMRRLAHCARAKFARDTSGSGAVRWWHHCWTCHFLTGVSRPLKLTPEHISLDMDMKNCRTSKTEESSMGHLRHKTEVLTYKLLSYIIHNTHKTINWSNQGKQSFKCYGTALYGFGSSAVIVFLPKHVLPYDTTNSLFSALGIYLLCLLSYYWLIATWSDDRRETTREME